MSSGFAGVKHGTRRYTKFGMTHIAIQNSSNGKVVECWKRSPTTNTANDRGSHPGTPGGRNETQLLMIASLS